MDSWLQFVLSSVVIPIVLGVIGFFAGRTFERRWNPIIWRLEATSEDRVNWRLIRSGGGLARDVSFIGSNGAHPIRTMGTGVGASANDIAVGQSWTIELHAYVLSSGFLGTYGIVWIGPRERMQADFTLTAGQGIVEIRRSDAHRYKG